MTKYGRAFHHNFKRDDVEYSLHRVADLINFNREKDDLFDYDEMDNESLEKVSGGGIPDREYLLKKIMEEALL